MDFTSIPTQDKLKDSPVFSSLPKPGWVRVIYCLFAVILPAFSFWAISFLKPEWQSGELDAYLALFLQPEASLVFLVLLAYSAICYILLLINPDRYSAWFVIRFGLYTGTLLALQYSLILIWYLFDNLYSLTIVLLWLFPLYFPKLYWWAVHKLDERKVNLGLGILFPAFFVVTTAIYREPMAPLVIVLTLLVAAAPFWSFLMVFQAARWLYKNYESKLNLQHGFGIVAWLAVYVAAWH